LFTDLFGVLCGQRVVTYKSVKQHHLYNVEVSFLSLVFSDLLTSKSLEPTPPPTPPSTVVNMRKKWMKEDVKNAFL